MSTVHAIPMMFYTKPGCHLCEDVAEELEILSEQWPLQITAVDITTDLEIHRRYWDKIPVVVVGERMLAAPIVPEALRALVASSAQQMR